jgi:hypothetical protein
MSIDVLLQYCLLLAAVVAAFAISAGIGMLVAGFWAEPAAITVGSRQVELRSPSRVSNSAATAL